MIAGGAVVGKVLGRRKWAKKGRRVYKRGFRGYLRAKPGGAISAKTAGQCGRTDGYTPGGLLDLSGQHFRSHIILLEQRYDVLTIRCPDQDPLTCSREDRFSSN